MRPFRAALVLDDRLRAEANERGENYWPAYYREALARIGLPCEAVGSEALTTGALAEYDVLLLPPGDIREQHTAGRAGKPAPPDGERHDPDGEWRAPHDETRPS